MLRRMLIPAFLCMGWMMTAAGAVALNENGSLRLNSSRMEWWHAPAWRQISLKGAALKKTGALETLSGRCRISPNHKAEFRAELRKTGERKWRYSADLRLEGKTDSLSFQIKYPVEIPVDLEISGKVIELKGEKTKGIVYSTPGHLREKSLVLVAGNSRFTIRGSFRVRVNDARVWSKEPLYSVSIQPEIREKGTRAALQLEIEEELLTSVPLPLASAANMGFRDEKADDGRGGWTDQGPVNDLSCLQPGDTTLAGIRFHIADPGKLNRKSCVVRSTSRRYPSSGAVAVNDGTAHRYLMLLHAAAWVPPAGEKVGSVVVTYADSSRQEIPVRAGIDCGNWWAPRLHFPNGVVAWSGVNKSGMVGLYVSAFRLKEKAVKTVDFRPGKGVWMIAAASFANLRPGRMVGKPHEIVAGKMWKPYEMPLRYRKGSPLDFSRWTDAPAGKFGRVIVHPAGYFSFERAPERRIRFFGTNICQRLVAPTHEEADLLAERLAAEGYNSIRFHQFEKFIMDWSRNDTLHFNKENLDRFHYFYARLREKGMYITTDIYATRPIKPGDRIAECRSTMHDGYRKVLQFFSDSALDNWKEYARRVLTMKNPYTGMSMVEDPAFFSLNLDNEAPLFAIWRSIPELLPLIASRYEQWLKEKGIYTPELAAERGEKFWTFLAERQNALMNEEIRFLREELGVKALITNLNNVASPSLQVFRDSLPVLDQHIYHDHPSYPMNNWQPPVAFKQDADLEKYASAMRACMPVRIPGKPMMITEINYCYPNQYRSEMGALAGGYAALQDWYGLYRFCYEFRRENIFKPKAPGAFSSFPDPIATLTERIIYFLFARGDVSAASNPPLCYAWKSERYGERFPAEFSNLGLIGKIGSVSAASKAKDVVKLDCSSPGWESKLPEAFRRADALLKRNAAVSSLTGEIMLDPAGSVRVVTPRSEVLTFRGASADGKVLKVRKAGAFTTVSVHSLDGKPLRESREILLFHLTDSLASGTQFQTPLRDLMLKSGHFPMLVARGSAEISLGVSGSGWQAEALRADGSTLASLPLRTTGSGIAFTVSTHSPKGCSMIYHLSRPQQNGTGR